MYQNLLVPTDGSTLSTDAVRQAVTFAKEAGAKVVLLTVTKPPRIVTSFDEQVDPLASDDDFAAKERAAQGLADASRIAATAGVACDLVQVEHDHPYQAIIETAENKGCDLIAMASHGRKGVAALLLGSETVKVLTHSKLPVLVYR